MYTNFYIDVELVDLYLKFALLFYINFRIIKLLRRPPLTLKAPTWQFYHSLFNSTSSLNRRLVRDVKYNPVTALPLPCSL